MPYPKGVRIPYNTHTLGTLHVHLMYNLDYARYTPQIALYTKNSYLSNIKYEENMHPKIAEKSPILFLRKNKARRSSYFKMDKKTLIEPILSSFQGKCRLIEVFYCDDQDDSHFTLNYWEKPAKIFRTTNQIENPRLEISSKWFIFRVRGRL